MEPIITAAIVGAIAGLCGGWFSASTSRRNTDAQIRAAVDEQERKALTDRSNSNNETFMAAHKDLTAALRRARAIADDWRAAFNLDRSELDKLRTDLNNALAQASLVSGPSTVAASSTVVSEALTAVEAAHLAGVPASQVDPVNKEQWELWASLSSDRFNAAFTSYLYTVSGDYTDPPV